MSLFSNPRKELDSTLDGLLLNFEANNGNRSSSAVTNHVSRAEQLIDRLVAKGQTADAVSAVSAIAAKTPGPVAFFRGGAAEVNAAAATLADRHPSDEMLAGWAELCATLRARTGA